MNAVNQALNGSLLAATHMSPLLTLAFSTVLLFGMAWYWPRLGQPGIPPQRRRVRRASLLFCLVGVIAATLGFGIIDPDARPVPYAFAWLAAATAILVVILLAALDALLSVRLHHRAVSDARRQSAEALGKAIVDARAGRNSTTDEAKP
jgi:drug/metabolite transporter (DMT)-like permease